MLDETVTVQDRAFETLPAHVVIHRMVAGTVTEKTETDRAEAMIAMTLAGMPMTHVVTEMITFLAETGRTTALVTVTIDLPAILTVTQKRTHDDGGMMAEEMRGRRREEIGIGQKETGTAGSLHTTAIVQRTVTGAPNARGAGTGDPVDWMIRRKMRGRRKNQHGWKRMFRLLLAEEY